MKKTTSLFLLALLIISLGSCKIAFKRSDEFPRDSIVIHPQDGAENIPTLLYFAYATQAKETTIVISDNKEDLNYPIKNSSSVFLLGPIKNDSNEYLPQYTIFFPKRLKGNTTYYWRYINTYGELKYISKTYKFTTTNIVINATTTVHGIAGITDNNFIYTIDGSEVSFYNSKLEKIKTVNLPVINGNPIGLINISYYDGHFIIGIDSSLSVYGLIIKNNKVAISWKKDLHIISTGFQVLPNGQEIPISKLQMIKMLDNNRFVLVDIPTNPENSMELINSLILGIYDISGESLLSANVSLSDFFSPSDFSMCLNISDNKIHIMIENNGNVISLTLAEEDLKKISEKIFQGYCLNENFIVDNEKIYTINDSNSLVFIGNYYYESIDYTSEYYYPSDDINNVYIKNCSYFHDDTYACVGKSIDYERFVLLSKNKIIKTEFLSKSGIDFSTDTVQYYYTKLMPDGSFVVIYLKKDGTWDIFSITVP